MERVFDWSAQNVLKSGLPQKSHVVAVRDSGRVTAEVMNVADACSTAGPSRA